MGLRSVLFEHPLAKALGFNLLGILGTIFGGAYIFEITKPLPNGGQYLDWRSFGHTYSFWLLAGVLLLMGLYSWGVERFDKKVQRALSNAEKSLVRRICGRRRVPAAYQVHDTRRFR